MYKLYSTEPFALQSNIAVELTLYIERRYGKKSFDTDTTLPIMYFHLFDLKSTLIKHGYSMDGVLELLSHNFLQ